MIETAELWNLAGALLAIVAVIYGLSFIVRRLRQTGETTGDHIRIISSTYLSPKDRLVVVAFHDRQLVLTLGPNPVTLVADHLVENQSDAPHLHLTDMPESNTARQLFKKISSQFQSGRDV